MQTKKLKSLEAANREAMERHEQKRSGIRPNGIACPVCGRELSDRTDHVLTSNPPQVIIECRSCGYGDRRIV